jgi:hypothetical protein
MTVDDGVIERPLLAVVRGDATAEEIAALVAVVAARAATATAPPVRPRGAWADPVRRLRRPVRAGPGGWRASASPPPR